MRALITWKWARVEKACRSGVEAEVGEKIFKLRAQKPRVSAYINGGEGQAEIGTWMGNGVLK